jgi:hypothetical protein
MDCEKRLTLLLLCFLMPNLMEAVFRQYCTVRFFLPCRTPAKDLLALDSGGYPWKPQT